MDSQNIILVGGSRFLRTMVKRTLMKTEDLQVVDEVTNLEMLPTAIREHHAGWVICFLQPGSDIPEVIETWVARDFPSVRILGIVNDGSLAKLEWIGFHQRSLDGVSLEELRNILRSISENNG